jgi:hypothetical protein
LIVLSLLPLTNKLLLTEVKHLTAAKWPASVFRQSLLSKLQILINLSEDPLAIILSDYILMTKTDCE